MRYPSPINPAEFFYALPDPKRKASVVPPLTIQTMRCPQCGGEFTTKSRTKYRCNPCQAVVMKQREVRRKHQGPKKKWTGVL